MTKRKYVKKEKAIVQAPTELQVVQNDKIVETVKPAPQPAKSYKIVLTLFIKEKEIKGVEYICKSREVEYIYSDMKTAQLQLNNIAISMQPTLQNQKYFIAPKFGTKCELIENWEISDIIEE